MSLRVPAHKGRFPFPLAIVILWFVIGFELELASGFSSSSSKNLWSMKQCLEQWNRQKEEPTTTNTTRIQFVDATWFHKGERDGRREFEAGPRLPGAFHWDTGDLATSGDLFPDENPLHLNNVFPPEWMVGLALEQMGVSATNTTTTTLVVYGREGTLFAPRVWYLLKRYARAPVKLLQGSLEDWIRRGGPFEQDPIHRSSPRCLSAKRLMADRNAKQQQHPLISPLAKQRLVDKAFVEAVLEKEMHSNNKDDFPLLPTTIIDTRGSSFAKNGHIPGAIHIPYASVSLADDPLTLRPKAELETILREALTSQQSNHDRHTLMEELRSQPVMLTCGTGVSVCTLALVLDELGFPEPWIYDGSWEEWGQDPFTRKQGGQPQ